jgi:hypothetical protein
MAKAKVESLTVKPSEAAVAIRAMMPTNRAIFMWGPPGISKSQVSQQVATEERMAFIDMRLSQMDPTDLRGIPYPTKVGGVEGVRWSTPYIMPRDLDLNFVVAVEAEETPVYFGNPVGSNGVHYCTNPKVEVRPINIDPKHPLRAVVKPNSETLDSFVVAIYDAADYDAKGDKASPVAGKVRVLVKGETRAILALEEFNSAPPSVQAAAYQLVLDRRLGEYEVPNLVYIMGMGNRDTDKGVTYKMPTPIMNRFVHLEMRVDFDDWQRWALLNTVSSEVVGYLTAFKNHLFEFEPGTAARGFATPRSWEFVSDILLQNEDLPDMVMLALISGAVGDGIGVQFTEFRKIAKDLPQADHILSGKLKKMPKKVEVSLAYALTTTLCYELKERVDKIKRQHGAKWMQSPERGEWLKEADHFLAFIMENFQPEICIMGSKAAIQVHKLPFDTQKMKNFDVFADKYRGLIMN